MIIKTEISSGIFSRPMFRFCVIFLVSILFSAACNSGNKSDTLNKRSTSTQPEREIKQYVIITDEDSVFHYSTTCSHLNGSPKLSNEYVERKAGKWMCDECGIKEAEFLIHKEEYMDDLRKADSMY